MPLATVLHSAFEKTLVINCPPGSVPLKLSAPELIAGSADNHLETLEGREKNKDYGVC